MNPYDNTFSRYEKKYMLTDEQYKSFMQLAENHLKKDRFGETTILNIYFDTKDYRLIRESIQKPAFKEKFRLRSYCVPTADDTVFLEIKRKYDGVVFKRRIAANYKDVCHTFSKAYLPKNNSQIGKEIDYLFKYYDSLVPSMFISYDRISWCDNQDSNLRITFDNNITYRNYDLSLQKGIYGESLLPKNTYLLEIKIPNAMPLWLCRILSELYIYPVSFSKYGKAYINTLTDDTKYKGGNLSA